MKLLYGTGNPAKLDAMKSRLENLNIELIGLNDWIAERMTIPKVPEDGATPLENARQKATAYYEAMEPSMESEKFILTDIPYGTIRKRGFPLDSMPIDIKTNKYFYDLPVDRLEQIAVEEGFLLFFKRVLNLD